MANLEAKHSVIKLVPEGGEIIEEGGLLHGVALNHAVHEPQGTQHDVTLPTHRQPCGWRNEGAAKGSLKGGKLLLLLLGHMTLNFYRMV